MLAYGVSRSPVPQKCGSDAVPQPSLVILSEAKDLCNLPAAPERPQIDDSAKGMAIVQSRNRQGQQVTPMSIRLIVFFAAWFFAASGAFCAIVSAPAAAASPVPQSDVRGHDAQDPGAALASAEALIAANKFGEAESRLSAYLTDHPDSSRAYYDLGYLQFRTHRIGPSIKQLSKSLELNPNNSEAHKVLGLNCSIIGRYDLAEVELLEAVRLKPESAENHYFLARTYYTLGVYPLAKSEFETTIRLNPSYTKGYSNLGITLEALGDNDGALRNYKAAIRLEDHQEQKSEWPYIYLGSFYNRQKNAAGALLYARKAIELNPASDIAYFEMAKAYRTQKQLQKAVDAARQAVTINSQVPDYFYVLGLVLRELGNQPESDEALKKYAQLQQQSNQLQPARATQEPLLDPEPK
jgi:tetratricopeptide (TPR) repeat protein